MTYDVKAAIEAQERYLKSIAEECKGTFMYDNMKNGTGFGPSDGVCYCCHRNIYSEGGISVETAGKEMTTECPFCHRDYTD